ncbi:MAG: NTP transferase domain-containing protein [Saprospiraceae bacterium]|nr:NTP transferase domain-containing protein [Saprospiraceae bacterium]
MKANKKHQKHPPLTRPKIGNYHRLEWAVYGTTCGEIETFFENLNTRLAEDYRLSYIDADHSDATKNTMLQVGKKQYAQPDFVEMNAFDDKLNVPHSQAVIVNGNHFPAQRQIVIINAQKKDSLYRRVEQLTQIDVVIVPSDEGDIFDFVKEKITENTLVISEVEIEKVYVFVASEIQQNIPEVKALILAGGKSSRMKEDKARLVYHQGIPHEEYLGKMCQKLGLETYISKSASEEQSVINGIPVLNDRMVDMGPFGAILSAFMHAPDAAWLVIACDLPYLNEEVIQNLLKERSFTHLATAYKLEENPFPEPLITIYETGMYRRMLHFLTLGYACPRKVLINSDIKHVRLVDSKVAYNANTPEEKEEVLKNMK